MTDFLGSLSSQQQQLKGDFLPLFCQMVTDLTADNPLEETHFLDLVTQSPSDWSNLVSLYLLHTEAWPERSPPQELEQKRVALHPDPSNQLKQTCRAIVEFLVLQQQPTLHPEQTESGCSPEEFSLLTTLPALPSPLLHAKQGVMWALLGVLTQQEEWIEAAHKLAQWQLNTCHQNGKPLISLFSRETSTSLNQALLWNYLLFNSLSLIKQDASLAGVAQKQLACFVESGGSFEGVPLLITHWFNKRFAVQLEPQEASFEANFDSTLPLVVKHLPKASLFCTLSGKGTGMGALRSENLAIINYGPHQTSLEDQAAFGIDASIDGLTNHNQAQFKQNGESFTLSKPIQLTHAKGHWVDATQKWEQDRLSVEMHFLDNQPRKDLTFVSYVQAESCQLESGIEVKSTSLERFRGGNAKLFFTSGDRQLEMTAAGASTMEIIPLAGGDNFWGANFLISYPIDGQSLQWEAKILFKSAY